MLKKSSKERNDINSRTTSVANRVISIQVPTTPKPSRSHSGSQNREQAIVSMPFEVLVEIGLEIKKKSAFDSGPS